MKKTTTIKKDQKIKDFGRIDNQTAFIKLEDGTYIEFEAVYNYDQMVGGWATLKIKSR